MQNLLKLYKNSQCLRHLNTGFSFITLLQFSSVLGECSQKDEASSPFSSQWKLTCFTEKGKQLLTISHPLQMQVEEVKFLLILV